MHAGPTIPIGSTISPGLIVTLCGSTRFERLFHAWNKALTIAGNTVFSLTTFPSVEGGDRDWYTEEVKNNLDVAHLRKIALSDAVVVLNRHGYIGESTMNEIRFAREQGKTLYALESWGEGFGITVRHTLRHREQAHKDDCFGFRSPIPTFSPHFRDATGSDLLGPPGKTRSTLVVMLENARWTVPERRNLKPSVDGIEPDSANFLNHPSSIG